jgi:outer membrane protein with beta-barrel domain
MRSVLTILAAGALLALQGTASAVESEFQITPRAGLGDLRIDQFEGVDDNLAVTDTYGLGVGMGFLTPAGIVFEAGVDNFGDFDFFNTFDSFSLSQKSVSVGYQFELGEGWRLVPRVGRAHWKLRSEAGRIFNPGPEAVRSISGDSYFWEASVSRRISRVVTLGMNYKQGNFDFGRSRTASFIVTLGF